MKTKRQHRKLLIENTRNIPGVVRSCKAYGNIFKTINIRTYAREMVSPANFPLTLIGNNSPISVHGMINTPTLPKHTYPRIHNSMRYSLDDEVETEELNSV